VYIVYILKDGDVPLYVGKGSSLERAFSHEKFAKSGDIVDLGYGLTEDYNIRKTRKIKKILRENREVQYEIKEYCTEQAAFDEEVRLISLYGRRGIDTGGILMNIHPGGIGGDVYSTLSDERKQTFMEKRRTTLANLSDVEKEKRRKKRSLQQKQIMATMPEEKKLERIRKISEAKTGRSNGPSPKKGIPATGSNAKGVRKAWNKDIPDDDPRKQSLLEGITRYYENRDRQWTGGLEKPFKLISPTGEIVEGNNIEWLVETHAVSGRIQHLIKGKIDQHCGWIRFEDKDSIIPKPQTVCRGNRGTPQKIGRYSLTGEFLDEWPTIKAAANNFGFSPGTMSSAILNERVYNGFLWKKL
jgi:hypothetical protein